MRPPSLSRIVLLPAILFICGCSSNQGKIESTRWTSLAAEVKGQTLPAGALQLAFGGDSKVVVHAFAPTGGSPTSYRGTYSLGIGDAVTLSLDRELAGSKTHVETIVIEGDRLTMTDSDGTKMIFTKMK